MPEESDYLSLLAEATVAQPLAEQVAVGPKRGGKKKMTVGDTVGDPVEERVSRSGRWWPALVRLVNTARIRSAVCLSSAESLI